MQDALTKFKVNFNSEFCEPLTAVTGLQLLNLVRTYYFSDTYIGLSLALHFEIKIYCLSQEKG